MLDKAVETFVKVADMGSFGKAANALGVTTGAVMKRMERLEQYVGVPLVKRSSQGVELTRAGVAFRQDADQLIAMERSALDHARSAGSRTSQRIRLGNSMMNPASLVMCAWYHAVASHPELRLSDMYEVELVLFDDSDTFDNILGSIGKRYDMIVGIADRRYLNDSLAVTILERAPLCVMLPKRHPLAKRASLSIADFCGMDVFAPPVGAVHTVDKARAWLACEYPDIHVIEPPRGSEGVQGFNYCERECMPIISNSFWRQVHLGFVAVPVDWDIADDVGLIYDVDDAARLEPFAEVVRDAWRASKSL